MSDNRENNETEAVKAQPNIFAQFKKPTAALVIIVILVSFGKLYNNPNAQKKPNSTDKAAITEATSTNQPQQNTTAPSIAAEPQSPPAVTVNPEVTNRDNERLNELEEKITQMQAAHEAEINELKTKFAAQNAASQSKANSMLSALVAFGQLKDAVNNGQPYDSELSQLLKITGDDNNTQEILSGFKDHSANGIITPALLKEKFPSLAKAAIFTKGENSYKNILHKFITIRKTGQQAGDDDESIISRAEFKLTHDDLKGALNELAALTPQAQPVFADWMQDAHDWLDAQEKLAKLQLLITQTEIAPQP